MTVISLRIDTQEDKLFKEYAKAKNISVSALIRSSVLEKIEDEIDLGLYNQAMKDHKENPKSISFEDMLKELSDEMSSGYQVEFEKGAQKALKKMDKYQSLLIMGWIQKNLVNCTDPRQHGKGLTVNRSGEWRYRIGDYRLIADINDETVTILMLEIGHRKNIYK